MKNTFIIIFACCFLSCSTSKYVPIVIDPLEQNPTEYIFYSSKQEVEKAIIEAFGGRKSSKKSKFSGYFLSEYPKGSFKLLSDGGNLSKVYFRKNGEAYRYIPTIQIVIDSIAESTTKVSINITDPKIFTRLTLLPTFPWMERGGKYLIVSATTVEEYEILLMIGKELKEENMPELKIPQKIILKNNGKQVIPKKRKKE